MQSIGLLLFGAGLVVFTLSIVANESFPRPSTIATGNEVCIGDGVTGSERCGDEYKLVDIDIGNPGWVDWFQRQQSWSIFIGFILIALGLYGYRSAQATHDQQIRILRNRLNYEADQPPD